MKLINKNTLLENFNSLCSWEEKYLYLIDLGKSLDIFPKNFYLKKNQILGCQSNVWIVVKKIKNNINFYGDSDSIIVKGLIAIVFIFYQNMNCYEIFKFDIQKWIKKINLVQKISISRSQGLELIINHIKKEVKKLAHK